MLYLVVKNYFSAIWNQAQLLQCLLIAVNWVLVCEFKKVSTVRSLWEWEEWDEWEGRWLNAIIGNDRLND